MNVSKCVNFWIVVFGIVTSANAQEVYKCGTHYTDQPCVKGHVIDTTPAIAEANMTTIYRCDPIHAKPFWIAQPCSEAVQGLKQIDSGQAPKEMDIHQQVEYLYQKRAKQKSGTR